MPAGHPDLMPVTARLLVFCLAAALAGCAARSSEPAASAPLPVVPFEADDSSRIEISSDPSVPDVAMARREFDAGQQALDEGRLVAARVHFDAAVDRLTAIRGGARAHPASSEMFDRLLDRISALEVLVLREGDAAREPVSESAVIDELLAAALFERPAPASTTAETVRAHLARGPQDFVIPPNSRVLSYVEAFQGRLREFITDGMARGQRYLPMIRRVLREEGVPLDLAFVPLVESGFKPAALSRASARGIWQFMAGTGREYGLARDWFIDERSDPEKSTRAAARYLRVLADMFDGDWALALASYNGGPGRVQRALRSARVADFWTLSSSRGYLPRETREYVPMVMAAIVIARDPSLYGFDVPTAEPETYERVMIPQALDLKYVAEWSGVALDELRDLNPELRRTTTPMESHALKVPVGTAPLVEQQLPSAGAFYLQFGRYVVRRGDTLSRIARQYGVSVAELRQANSLGSRSLIRIDQTLMIPQRPPAGLPTPVTRTVAASPRPAPGVATYRVQRGDTLYGIARRFATTIDAIKQANSLTSNLINIGDQLVIR